MVSFGHPCHTHLTPSVSDFRKTTITRRYSDISDLETDPVCTMDPMFRQGRVTQLLGLISLPLLPAAILIVYCSVKLTRSVKEVEVATGVIEVVEGISPVWDLVLQLLGEMDGIVSLIASNGTAVLGSISEFYSPTDASMKASAPWLEKANLNLIDGIQQHRLVHLNMSNLSILGEVEFYSRQVNAINDATFDLLDTNLRVIFWPDLVSYYHLLQSLLAVGVERSLGTVSFIRGYLTEYELGKIVGATETGSEHLTTATQYSIVVHHQLEQRFTSDSYLSDWFNSVRQEVLRDEPLEQNFFGAVVWYRKLSSMVLIIRNIERELTIYAMEHMNEGLVTNAILISIYVFIISCLTFITSPFLCAAAYKSVSSLVQYAEAIGRTNFELKKEKRKTEALLNQMLPRAVAYRMRKGEEIEAESYDSVTVFFSDITDFTEISMTSSPIDIVLFLNEIYLLIDTQVTKYDVYKVETISASYMVVSGLPSRNGSRHSMEIARFSLDLMELTETFQIQHLPNRLLQLRIGCHTGRYDR